MEIFIILFAILILFFVLGAIIPQNKKINNFLFIFFKVIIILASIGFLYAFGKLANIENNLLNQVFDSNGGLYKIILLILYIIFEILLKKYNKKISKDTVVLLRVIIMISLIIITLI